MNGHPIPRPLAAASIRQRARGASDAEALWSLIASLAASNGALLDLDALCEDQVGQRLPGVRHVPSGRRLGEYPARIGEARGGMPPGWRADWPVGWRRRWLNTKQRYAAAFRCSSTAPRSRATGLFEEARHDCDGTRRYRLYGV